LAGAEDPGEETFRSGLALSASARNVLTMGSTETADFVGTVQIGATPPLNVLVAEDDAVSRHILEVRLRSWGYNVRTVVNGVQALDAMQSQDAPTLLLLDWMMPGIDGIELCRRIRAQQMSVYPYILLLTARDAKRDLVIGLEAGADDYLTKPFHADELRARLRTGNRILTLQRELIRAKEQLRFEATHDVLTGIWNRRAIVDFLAQELARAQRDQQPVGVMMVDLDHFKSVNDTYGHAVGDAVLKKVATCLVRSVRSYDWVGRYGGEEFLIVLSNTSLSDVKRRGERLCAAVSGSPMGTEAREIRITVSIGAAVTSAQCPISQDRLLHLADTALYRAKECGRNRVETRSVIL
jgi:two-component system, cell cycle response regulator